MVLQEGIEVALDMHAVPRLLELRVADHLEVPGFEAGSNRLARVRDAVRERPPPGIDQRRESMVDDRPEPEVGESIVDRKRELPEFGTPLVLTEDGADGDGVVEEAERRGLTDTVPPDRPDGSVR
jgi:hypothetical protein